MERAKAEDLRQITERRHRSPRASNPNPTLKGRNWTMIAHGQEPEGPWRSRRGADDERKDQEDREGDQLEDDGRGIRDHHEQLASETGAFRTIVRVFRRWQVVERRIPLR